MVPPQDAGRPAAASGGPAVTGPIRRLPPHGAEEPPWPRLAALTVAFGVVMIPLAFTSVSLYWYAFPLFGIGVAYVLQFRDEFPMPWKVTLLAAAVVSAVALALDWPFSGHLLWNVLFIGHALRWGRRRRTWLLVLAASMVHLFVLKALFQTGRDLVGGFISVAVALVVLAVLAALAAITPGSSSTASG